MSATVHVLEENAVERRLAIARAREHRQLDGAAHEIARKYVAKGLRGPRLVSAMVRHARVLAGEDPELSEALLDFPYRKLAELEAGQ